MADDLKRRLLAISNLVSMILNGDELVTKDERAEPEMRDVMRMAGGELPRTHAGKTAWEIAFDSGAEEALPVEGA